MDDNDWREALPDKRGFIGEINARYGTRLPDDWSDPIWKE